MSATFHYLCLCKQFVKLLLKIKRILLLQKQLKKIISIKTETENKQQHENISFVLFINYVETTFGFFTIIIELTIIKYLYVFLVCIILH